MKSFDWPGMREKGIDSTRSDPLATREGQALSSVKQKLLVNVDYRGLDERLQNGKGLQVSISPRSPERDQPVTIVPAILAAFRPRRS